MATGNREGGVVGVGGARDKRVGEGVVGIDVGRGECADDRADRGVLGNGAGRQGEVGWGLVDIGDRNPEVLLGVETSGVGGADAYRVGVPGLVVERCGGGELAADNREGGVVGVAGT